MKGGASGELQSVEEREFKKQKMVELFVEEVERLNKQLRRFEGKNSYKNNREIVVSNRGGSEKVKVWPPSDLVGVEVKSRFVDKSVFGKIIVGDKAQKAELVVQNKRTAKEIGDSNYCGNYVLVASGTDVSKASIYDLEVVSPPLEWDKNAMKQIQQEWVNSEQYQRQKMIEGVIEGKTSGEDAKEIQRLQHEKVSQLRDQVVTKADKKNFKTERAKLDQVTNLVSLQNMDRKQEKETDAARDAATDYAKIVREFRIKFKSNKEALKEYNEALEKYLDEGRDVDQANKAGKEYAKTETELKNLRKKESEIRLRLNNEDLYEMLTWAAMKQEFAASEIEKAKHALAEKDPAAVIRAEEKEPATATVGKSPEVENLSPGVSELGRLENSTAAGAAVENSTAAGAAG